jgi:hypothetical protein
MTELVLASIEQILTVNPPRNKKKQDRYRTYKVIMIRAHETVVAVEKK